jgi:hypothetical protein
MFDLFKKAFSYMMLIVSCHVCTSVAALDKIEDALGKFNEGPFSLGQFSLVCHWTLGILLSAAWFKIKSLLERVHIMNVGFGCHVALSSVMCNFTTGGHCVCTIHREVSDILFQHKEL